MYVSNAFARRVTTEASKFYLFNIVGIWPTKREGPIAQSKTDSHF